VVENAAERGAKQSTPIQILQRVSEKVTMPEPVESGGLATIDAEGSDPRADSTLVQHVQVVQPLVESGVGPAADGTLENKLLDGGGYVEISLSADSQLGDQVDAALEAHSLFSGQAQVPPANSSGSLFELSDEPHSPLESYAGHNCDLQLVQRASVPLATEEVAAERQALGRMKAFCSRILKALAPPLLQEVESASTLRADAEPFTPRRSSRFSASSSAWATGKASRKASATESALLKALGINVEGLAAKAEVI
jgi:hypothetical protein